MEAKTQFGAKHLKMRFRRIVKIPINEIAYTQIEYLYLLLAMDGQGRLRVVTHIN